MRSFFDTNILVYLFDQDAPDKQRLAQLLLQSEGGKGTAVLSTQVLQEFYVTVTRKLAHPLSPEDAERAVQKLVMLPVTQVDASLVLAAIRRSQALRFSFWDALIVEAAIVSGAQRLLTEDLQHGQRIDGLEIHNPFLAG